LTWFVDRDKPKRQRLVFWLTFAYGAVMAYTRVRILAHFTGDVTMSLILTWSLILILAAVVQQPLVDWEALTARSSAKNLNT
ncbi:phosphatase PAP2 family protein, partial [Lactiplantibacillus plantarum]